MNKSQILGTVLSGGKSSRMGRDKGLMNYKNKPLVAFAIDLLKHVTNQIVISTNDMQYKQFGYPLVPDLISNIGPIGGIYSVMKQTNTLYYMVIACDMPFASKELANKLLLHTSEADIVVPVHDNKIEPLFGIYSREILSIIEQQINRNNYKLMRLLDCCNTKYLDINSFQKTDTDNFKNINSPEDAEF